MKSRKKKRNKLIYLLAASIGIVIIGLIIFIFPKSEKKEEGENPKDLLVDYMNCIANQDYEKMYAMINVEESGGITKEDFVKRNTAIYDGIETTNLSIDIISYDEKSKIVQYKTSMDTIAGNISFENQVKYSKQDDGYKLNWKDSLIFPDLDSSDKVRVSTTLAKRGEILDRNGKMLAGEGVVSSIGIVPGKMEDKEGSIQKIAQLLNIEQDSIEKKLSAQWVTDETFVPITVLPKVDELSITSISPNEEMVSESKKQEELKKILGVSIVDKKVRQYPLGNAAAHLIGYVQSVTAQDLEEHKGEGYTESSSIGKTGMEALFEEKLKGKNGSRIYIVDSQNNEKKELACETVQNGENVKLTIDSSVQKALYEQFKEDKSCSVSINPYTGEVLALVSTPSYDNNDFIMGMTDEHWKELNESENKPMYNRFRQTWCPGSTFKPIIAAIGLQSGAIDKNEDYGNVGLKWQKDESWGSYYVTTLHAYEPVVLENALIYSDNIYFAKAALKIGADELKNSLTKFGFTQELPFEIKMSVSQYSNTENIDNEIQLADSGYGQGQILVNPLHMACIYTAFCNEGNIVKPYLVYKDQANAEFWISQAFSSDTARTVLDDIIKVVNDKKGTGYEAHRDDIVLAGKTGTAEIKDSKDDTTGTEYGWFSVFTAEKNVEKPIMIVSMVEDVKGRGGSGYVVKRDKKVLEEYWGK